MAEVHEANFEGVEWLVEMPVPWKEYLRWLGVQLSDFKPLSASDSEAFYSKSLSGDVEQLVVTVVSAGPPLKVRLRFRAFPD